MNDSKSSELGAIQERLSPELQRYRSRLDTLVSPAHARERIDEELERSAWVQVGSADYAALRAYLDYLTSLPWGRCSADQVDLQDAREILDGDYAGLDDVKDSILEFLAVNAFKGEVTGSILLLVGPPGVGKSSLGRSIARVMGRAFYRFSAGSLRDEGDIKGRRFSHGGAMPGKFIQAIQRVGTGNPVIVLGEIDKISAAYQGDPTFTLLEALDPEQNGAFLDHYLDVRFDLSKVLFICTANQMDSIPAPLLDRMQVIRLPGYITPEKIRIARRHLWPRLRVKAGLNPNHIKITDAAFKQVVEGYARDAGVLTLEQQLGKILRKAVVKLLGGAQQPVRIGVGEVEDYLGQPVFRYEPPITGVGSAMGLAWSAQGGSLLYIEAARVHTKHRGFKVTGMLGNVMKESAEIAYSYIAAYGSGFKGNPTFFDRSFVHLHVPHGATPKDGPSAGITIATALLSLARNEELPRSLTMTGELTLTGKVLAVGGIREKIIAAKRTKITELILPEYNRRDFFELPDYIRNGLTIHFVRHYRDVVRIIFSE